MDQKKHQIQTDHYWLGSNLLGSTQEKFVDQMRDCGLKFLIRILIHACGNLSVSEIGTIN